jgi:hypothetical protein
VHADKKFKVLLKSQSFQSSKQNCKSATAENRFNASSLAVNVFLFDHTANLKVKDFRCFESTVSYPKKIVFLNGFKVLVARNISNSSRYVNKKELFTEKFETFGKSSLDRSNYRAGMNLLVVLDMHYIHCKCIHIMQRILGNPRRKGTCRLHRKILNTYTNCFCWIASHLLVYGY